MKIILALRFLRSVVRGSCRVSSVPDSSIRETSLSDIVRERRESFN